MKNKTETVNHDYFVAFEPMLGLGQLYVKCELHYLFLYYVTHFQSGSFQNPNE